MCRLFGFRSVINSQVHSSLVRAENALCSQSLRHPDGWGVAFYLEHTPHIIKSTERAMDDQIFHKVSGVVSSKTVLAHIRKATQGGLNILNSHPFQYGKWVFGHNGNLKNFAKYREKLIESISPNLKRFVFGNTDSEVIFYLLLTIIEKHQPLMQFQCSHETMSEVVQELCDTITQYCGPLYGGKEVEPQESHLTFLITSGDTMYGFHGGMQLNYSTHKSLCAESDKCPHYAQVCVNQAKPKEKLNHLLFSSETLDGPNVWRALKHGELVGVDADMNFLKTKVNVDFT